MLKPPSQVFHEWLVETSPSPSRESCVGPLVVLVSSKLAVADVASLVLDSFANLAQTVRARSELSELICQETRDAFPPVFAELGKQVNARLSLQYHTPSSHLFYLYLACEMYRVGGNQVVGEEVLCFAVERLQSGKSRTIEAANRFAQLLQPLSEDVLSKFEKVACGKRLLKCIRVLCALTIKFTGLAQCYLDLAFKSQDDSGLDSVMFAFAPMFRRMTGEDVLLLLTPPVSRQIKLTTEKSLPACIALAQALTHATPRAVDEMFIQPARKALKTSGKENVQELSAKLISICLQHWEMDQVVKEMLEDITKEATLFRRCKMISSIAKAKVNDPTTRAKCFSVLLKRAVKDEKTDESKTLCFETAEYFFTFGEDGVLDAEAQALVLLATSAASGLRFIATVAKALSPNTVDAIKLKLRTQGEEGKLRLPSTLALLALNRGEGKINYSYDEQEDGLVMASILIAVSDHHQTEEHYVVLAKLLSTEQTEMVRQKARLALPKANPKRMLLAAVESGLTFSRTIIQEMLPQDKHLRDAEVLAMTLILTCRIKQVSFEKTMLPLFPSEAKHHCVRFAAPLLLTEPTQIDSMALLKAIALDPFCEIMALALPLVERLDYTKVEELDLDEAVIAAFSTPTGRLSDYQETRVNQQWENGEDQEDEERIRVLKQGRKGRGGIRKELYSLENLEWERKVRQEQRQKNALATEEEREKQRSMGLMTALREEQMLRHQVEQEITRYAETCKCIVTICSKAGEELSTQILPLVQLAKRSRFVGQYARKVLDAYLSLAFQRDQRFVQINRNELITQLQTGNVNALITLDSICQDSMQSPLNPELFEFVFPILLHFTQQSFANEQEEQVVDAIFQLVSIHRESIINQKREQLLPGLLRLCAKMPLQTSLHCITELFALQPPEEHDIQVFSGELGLLHEEVTVRLCALTALAKVVVPSLTLLGLLWFACSDQDERCRVKAEQCFQGHTLPSTYYQQLITSLLPNTQDHVRLQASTALALGIDEHPDEANKVVAYLLQAYHEAKTQLKSAAEKAQLAKESKFFDRSLLHTPGTETDVSWRWRSGVALALSAFAGRNGSSSVGGGGVGTLNGEEGDALGPVLERKEALECIEFVLQFGTSDPHTLVRAQMLASGTFLIQAYGMDLGEELLKLVQSHLEQGGGNALEADLQREGAVLLFGAAAANLDANDVRIPEIASKLIQALDTPSESVQRSVVRILPALMKCSKFKETNAKELVDVCFEKTVGPGVRHQASFGSRKGNAMGLAAIIKGLGIGSLKVHQLMPRLTEASHNDKWEVRQGALFCFDELCENLGRMFEPYAIQIVEPVFLRMFSDTQGDVREAAHQASKRVMANLSGPGVGMLLPKLLLGLSSTEWRTKHAAIQMLGSVAFCAPKQLASSLPLVVPKLIDTFTDTHAKVRSAAVAALRDVQSVVKNPEIDRIAPNLISALTDPHEKTKDAVDVLFSTRFVHEVDAPSLSLLIPILKRGLKERVTETKKKSALIIGNMISMVTDAKAVKPYLEDILPTLKIVLVDPIPGVRVTASKALGTLVRGLGRDGIPDFPILYQFLIDTMHTGQSSVERQGGAQGFVEVLCALEDDDLLHDGLELEIFSKIMHIDASYREGAIWGLVFLQTAMEDVKPWATRSLDVALLSGLADDVESVRDAAFRCARVYVGEFTVKDPQLVLTGLERGLIHPSWRVKHTSIRLLGEFIIQLQKSFWTGAHAGKASTISGIAADGLAQSDDEEEEESDEEEENDDNEEEETQEGFESPADGVLQKLFGSERRNRLISTIYLMRNDGSSQVRQTALHVWKSIVFNTPKMLRRIIGPLMQTTVAFLSSCNTDMQSMGGRALADVVRKLGDRVLPDIVPIVLRGLDSDNESERVGVAMGLFELVGASSKQSLEPQCEPVLFAVEKGLCDENIKVRELAGKTFNKVHVVLGGTTALSLVLDKLCDGIEIHPEANIRGLQQCVESRSRDSMTYLIPKLLETPPVTIGKAYALGQCMQVIPDYLHHYLPEIIRLVVRESNDQVVQVFAQQVFVNETFHGNQDAIRVFCRETCSAHSNHDSIPIKLASLHLLEGFLNSQVNVLSIQDAKICIQSIVKSFASKDPLVLTAAIQTFAALIKHVKDHLVEYVSPVRLAVSTLVSDEKYRGGAFASDELRAQYQLPAFQHKVCLDAMLELYLGPLVSNSVSHEIREMASIGLGEIVDVSGNDGLKLHTVKIAGPLIRIVGEPFPSSLKISILSTLTKLLGKQGVVLRPFLSQLQTTFVKALKNNTSDSVRISGLQALEVLVPLTPRIDPLVNELCQGCELNSESGLQMLQALFAVLQSRGGEISLAGLIKVLDAPILHLSNNQTQVDEDEEEADDEIPQAHGNIAVLLAMIEGKVLELALVLPGAEELLLEQLASRLETRLHSSNWRNLLVLDAMLRVNNGLGFIGQRLPEMVVTTLEDVLVQSNNPRVRAVAFDCAAMVAKNTIIPRAQTAMQPLIAAGSKAEKDARVRHFAKPLMGTPSLVGMREDFRALF
ncbi:hypothetical protein BASA81_005129 [Batrachochytrium salamandrivorans]|nr:hypothetical protein BASA81_005129 [Batrachochytrium salamandrivorans]